MPSDIKLGDEDVTIEGSKLTVKGDLYAATGLYLKRIQSLVQPGSTYQFAVHEVIPDLMAQIEALQAQVAALKAVRDFNMQDGWRWCNKCRTLVHSGIPGICATDQRPHTYVGSSNYCVQHTRTNNAGQAGWRWCDQCSSLFFGRNATGGRCPRGGEHNRNAASLPYFVSPENVSRNFCGQNEWRWCRLCESLFFGPHAGESACAAGGRHDATGSSDYVLDSR
ncbi:MAG TPA: hypothetical protein PKI03_38045 [Pseudomonadota bacterium]|nr:hypothetical protein [Pseudomonadota bacterium]